MLLACARRGVCRKEMSEKTRRRERGSTCERERRAREGKGKGGKGKRKMGRASAGRREEKREGGERSFFLHGISPSLQILHPPFLLPSDSNPGQRGIPRRGEGEQANVTDRKREGRHAGR